MKAQKRKHIFCKLYIRKCREKSGRRVPGTERKKRMRYIFADFEMNPVDRKFKEVRKICRSEIIEMGASMLDENMNEISCFRVYVKPQYNDKIVPYCEPSYRDQYGPSFLRRSFPGSFE